MEPNEGDAHDTAKRRVQARTELATHVGMYLIMNVGFVAIWALTGAH